MLTPVHNNKNKTFHLKTSFQHAAVFTRTIEHLNKNRCVVEVTQATDRSNSSKMSSTCVVLSRSASLCKIVFQSLPRPGMVATYHVIEIYNSQDNQGEV